MKFNILTLFACLVPLTACTTGIFIPGATFEPGVMPQIEAADQLSTQFAEQVQATVEARATLTYQATGVGATATAQQVATRPAADAAAFSLATAQAQPLYSTVQKLANTGMLGTTSGLYYTLQDFDASWAQLDYYDIYPSGYSPADFVLHAGLAWESASAAANWWDSGCGFFFRMNARGDHYLALIAMDGWVYVYRKLDDTITRLGKERYSQVVLPEGNADALLIAEGDQIHVMVNGTPVIYLQDAKISRGFLGYALASGTNRDFGTRCKITNSELWEIEK